MQLLSFIGLKPVKIKDFDISHLKACPRNAKKHDALQVQQIARSIEVFGFNNPVLIDSEGEIIAGHGRFEAAQLLRLDKVPCVVLDHLNDEQKRAFRIADNRLCENGGGWDDELLILELSDLRELAMDVELTGFTADDWQKMVPDDISETDADADDDAPDLEPEQPACSQPGDIWLLDNHRLMCGDSTIEEQVSALVGTDPVDMVWTDPPYNVDYDGGCTKKSKTRSSSKIDNDHLKHDEFCLFLKKLFLSCYQVVKCGGSFYCAHSSTYADAFISEFKSSGFKLSQVLVWTKNQIVLSRQDYLWQHEPILYGWKEGETHCWYGGRTQSTLLRANKPLKSKEHPTMKPVSLIMRMLTNPSLAGDRVLDPCGGSGSTLIACEKLKRQALLMEIDPKYCDVIIRRWQTFTGMDAVHESTGQTFNMKQVA
ncbi:MAG: site-specific DNA-methyltransferase [Shewanella sp.]|nr:site-specific DNA-methyltransferase [Shewanella sp.]